MGLSGGYSVSDLPSTMWGGPTDGLFSNLGTPRDNMYLLVWFLSCYPVYVETVSSMKKMD